MCSVNVWSNASHASGPIVVRYGGTVVTQQGDGHQVSYTVADDSDFGLRLTSEDFHGFKRDGWLFARANFSKSAEEQVHCLAAYSY